MASAFLALLMLLSLSVPAALAADVYYEAKSDVTIRQGAGTQYGKVTTVPKGDVVVVTSMWYKEWWKVKYTNANKKTYEGYIKSEYLKTTSKRSNEKKNLAPLGCYSTLIELNLRSGPGTGYSKRTVVPKGNVVNVTETKDAKWYKATFINAKGKKYTGYISANYLRKAAEPYRVKSKTQLRSRASTSSTNLFTLPKGSYLFVTSFYSSKWYKVNYTDIDGKLHTGYVLKSKLKKGTVTNKPYKQVDPQAEEKLIAAKWPTATRYQLKSKTKLTKSASKKGKKVATLSKGTVVAKIGSSGKFYKVIYNDSKNKKKLGYLPKSKLKKYTDSKAGDYVTKVATELRQNDSKTGKVLVELPKYTMFKVLDSFETDWYRVKYTDKSGKKHTGFIYKSHAEKYVEKNAGNYYTTVDTTLRKTESDTGSEVCDLPQGVRVKVKKTYNPKWYYVSYTDKNDEGHSGYVKSSYLKKFQNKKLAYVAYVDTEVRNQPSSSAQVFADVPEGSAVTVRDMDAHSKWYWATYKDENGDSHTGYILAAHLKTKEEYEAEQKPEEPEKPEEKPEEQTPAQNQENQQTPAVQSVEEPEELAMQEAAEEDSREESAEPELIEKQEETAEEETSEEENLEEAA
jgi:uncharacterized protein YgiM (DUF1202 family)